MITARQSKDWWRFLIGMKNFILEVATSRPSFSTSQTHLGDVSFLRRWPLLLPFSESAQMFRKGLEILVPQSFKLRNGYVPKYLNAKESVEWSGRADAM